MQDVTESVDLTDSFVSIGPAYLSGPMTGYEEHNFPEFNRVVGILRAGSVEVFNPAENFNGAGHKRSRADNMRLDIAVILKSSLIIVLPGWSDSAGATFEVAMAQQLDLPVFSYVDYDASPFGFKLEPVSASSCKTSCCSSVKRKFDGVCQEADSIVRGPRRKIYGPPYDDYTKVAGMFNSLFRGKIRTDAEFKAEDMSLVMVLIKLSREVHCSKRDNRVDIAGYAEVTDMIVNERLRRG